MSRPPSFLSPGWTHGRTLPHPSSSRFHHPGHNLPSLAALLGANSGDGDAKTYARDQQRFQNLQAMHALMDPACPQFMASVWPALSATPLGERLLDTYHLLVERRDGDGRGRIPLLAERVARELLGMRVRRVFIARFLKMEQTAAWTRANQEDCGALAGGTAKR